MRQNVIDIIIYLAKGMHIGMSLQDIKLDTLRGYNKSEISAAYSWLMQKYESGQLKHGKRFTEEIPSPRVLYPSERVQISNEVYGYLLELYYLGILDAGRMERIIEYALFYPDGKSDTSDVKEWVAGIIFDSEYVDNERSFPLKGNETIN